MFSVIFCEAATEIRDLASFPDPQKAGEDLQTFAQKNEGRLYKLLKTCMDVQTDLKNLVKARVRVASLLLCWPLIRQACSSFMPERSPLCICSLGGVLAQTR